jgi:hypothetical protein
MGKQYRASLGKSKSPSLHKLELPGSLCRQLQPRSFPVYKFMVYGRLVFLFHIGLRFGYGLG